MITAFEAKRKSIEQNELYSNKSLQNAIKNVLNDCKEQALLSRFSLYLNIHFLDDNCYDELQKLNFDISKYSCDPRYVSISWKCLNENASNEYKNIYDLSCLAYYEIYIQSAIRKGLFCTQEMFIPHLLSKKMLEHYVILHYTVEQNKMYATISWK